MRKIPLKESLQLTHDKMMGANVCANFKLAYTADEDIHNLEVHLANFYVKQTTPPAAVTEEYLTNTVAVAATLEYPKGVFRRLYSQSGTATVLLDWNAKNIFTGDAIFIPTGGTFWIRTYIGSTGSIPTGRPCDSTKGEGGTYSSTDVRNEQYIGVDPIPDNVEAAYHPVAVFANTNSRCKTSVILGDSINHGWGTDYTTEFDTGDEKGNRGFVARGLKKNYLKLATYGDSASMFMSYNPPFNNRGKRMQLVSGIDRAYIAFGIVDILHSTDFNEIKSKFLALWRELEAYGLTVYQCTPMPWTTSTDDYVTEGNQTVTSYENLRVQLANFIRSEAPNCIDISPAVETYINSGLWKTNGNSFGYTQDGIHPSELSQLLASHHINE